MCEGMESFPKDTRKNSKQSKFVAFFFLSVFVDLRNKLRFGFSRKDFDSRHKAKNKRGHPRHRHQTPLQIVTLPVRLHQSIRDLQPLLHQRIVLCLEGNNLLETPKLLQCDPQAIGDEVIDTLLVLLEEGVRQQRSRFKVAALYATSAALRQYVLQRDVVPLPDALQDQPTEGRHRPLKPNVVVLMILVIIVFHRWRFFGLCGRWDVAIQCCRRDHSVLCNC